MSNMVHTTADFESAPVAAVGLPVGSYDKDKDEKTYYQEAGGVEVEGVAPADDDELPTEEEMLTLRKVPAPMKWQAMLICLVELAERGSYYGCTGVFGNFIRGPLPAGGPGTGAVAPGAAGLNQSAGALGRGSVAASAVTTSFQFMAYVFPILGGIVSDTKWGRFRTIAVGTLIGAVAHVLLVIPAIPKVIAHPEGSMAAFIIAMVILAFAAGFIKPCLGPLLCDQSPVRRPTIKILASGERVILDPTATVQRYLLIFYWCINVGAFFAVATSYAERLIGFWLAYLLPGILYMLMPIVLVIVYKGLYKAPPQGSVVVEFAKVMKLTLSNGGWKKMWKGGDEFWDQAKPSYIQERDGQVDLAVVFWDDKFVDEIKQSLRACACFLLIPIFNLGDGGLGNSENSMSAAMTLQGVPNDLLSNFNPLTIIVVTPIITFFFYPMMARIGFPLKPSTRMAIGFVLCGMNMIFGAVIQARIYALSDCGKYASTCDTVTSVSLWWQIPLNALPAIGEIFVNVTSYELAYTRAPARMKGLVYAMVLFTTAISSAISLALSAVVTDPSIANFIGAACYPLFFRDMDKSVVFNNPERMEGKEQPTAFLEGRNEKN